MVMINIMGEGYILKRNPWLSGKLATAVAKKLASTTKTFIVSRPPPWVYNKEALSNAQLAQILRFSSVSKATAGRSIEERLKEIKEKASGPTGYPRKPRVRPANIGTIVTIARARGLTVPGELLAVATAPVAVAPSPRTKI